ncbi:prostaglandin E2 receptor EP4 subtype-like [Mytilus californianus]|uniref:prostaglandin E2 receptor EP4 subtype-like n=1 Tax=Mytilus californianus TaxID=6549 RepID=UPI0022476EE1|nr:prostaglandin E2 receptor EP4 subtype-like [Mytilus californianus]XP_052104320.1 prostaglandin E2 receptor EP4 subtype-like [Mytilus californianus]XP_052104331.1 prostaglandin E2 receptor EP4 subtype-like [Mytilus californianus]
MQYTSVNESSNNQSLQIIMGNTSASPQTSAFLPNITDFSSKKNNTVINSGIMFGAGVFGNILALIVLIRSGPEQKRTIFYRLVAGLCVTDLLGTTLTSPVVIAVYVNNFRWMGGTAMCNYFGYVMIMAGYATMLIVCSMSIERVVCIKHPLIYNARSSTKHATMILIFCWALAAFMAALPFMGFGNVVLQYPKTWCFFDYYTKEPVDKAFNYLFAILATVIIFVTACCNLTVMCTLIKSRRRQYLLAAGNGRRRYFSHSKRFTECQMLVQLVGITIVFSTCYMPLMARVIINQTELLPRNVRLDLIMIRFASLNQILDPWVYILLRRELLWKVISGFKMLCRIKQNEPDIIPQRPNFDIDNDTCCIFCYHCLCDPPVKRPRAESTYFSTYESEHRRSTLTPSTPNGIRRGSLSETNRNLCLLVNQPPYSRVNNKSPS